MNERLHSVLCHAEYHRLDGEKREQELYLGRAVRQDKGRGGHWC